MSLSECDGAQDFEPVIADPALAALYCDPFSGVKFTAPFKLTIYTILQGRDEARRQ